MGFCRPGCQAALEDTWEEGGGVREGDKGGRKREKRGRLQTACRVGARWKCSASSILYLLPFISALIVIFLHDNETVTAERKLKTTRCSEDRGG